jgi:exodeoxyribonuclease VII small subunit
MPSDRPSDRPSDAPADAPRDAQPDRAAAEKPSYEAAREELIEVVRALEAGGTTLEESLALWERGEKLATICQEWLDGARKRLDEAMAGEDG